MKNFLKLKEQKINLMITGATGCGKSSTINALFQTEVAKVGVGVDPETMDIQKYELDNLVLWDSPGLGDGKEADNRHAKNIIRKLNERDENGNRLIDLVLVILDGSTRDLGTSYELINSVIIPNLGQNRENRILIAINQADVAMKGRYWNYEENRPEPQLVRFLEDKVISVKKRIQEGKLSMFRDQLNEDRIRSVNRMHREMKIYFPEYKDALGKVDGAFSLELLKQAPFPEDLTALGEDGIRQIWQDARLRGRGYSRAGEILRYAKTSVGIKDGAAVGKTAVKWFVQRILELDAEPAVIENQINQKCQEIPHTGNILEISGIGENTLSGILAEMGDIPGFDDAREIQKLSGLGLVASSPGKHKGETKISHRGRKRLRYWLFQAAKSAVAHGEKFKELHMYYTTRADNPLKKMQSLIVIACKLLRIIYTILKNGTVYDPKKMLMDIRRPEKKEAAAA